MSTIPAHPSHEQRPTDQSAEVLVFPVDERRAAVRAELRRRRDMFFARRMFFIYLPVALVGCVAIIASWQNNGHSNTLAFIGMGIGAAAVLAMAFDIDRHER